MGDMVRLAYGHDVVKRTVKTMTEFDPEWKLPDGFFPAKPFAADISSEPKNRTADWEDRCQC
jgi:salicylate hydroxylase